ncbi:MAG: glycosyl hydrolase family 28 protein [Planctomycetota bacterium]
MPRSAAVYPAPEGLAPSTDFRVRVDGQEVFVYPHEVAAYAPFGMDGPVEVEVEVGFDFDEVVVRPLRHRIRPEVDGRSMRFELPEPAYLSIELDGDIRRPLFLWADPPEQGPPSPDEPGVRYFEGGRLHEPGLVELSDGDTVYIEAGAVVYGAFRLEGVEDVTVRGRGVLDGSRFPGRGSPDRGPWLYRALDCRNVAVEGVAMIDSPRWTLVPVGCRGVEVRNVKIVTDHVGGDGVDLVGCRDARVEDCFMRTADDCVAIKASAYRHDFGGRDVENIRVSGCVCWNAHPGNALEIGYETRCDRMHDIRFSDCDIIRVEHEGHQSGGTFTIHNGDRAEISDVRYENMRVEDSREKLVDIKVLYARYSRDEERGQVGDIRFRNIQVVDGPFPVSIIRGYDEDHMIGEITFENFRVHDRLIAGANEARMVVELAPRVRFLDA